jgi:hypothetical protein
MTWQQSTINFANMVRVGLLNIPTDYLKLHLSIQFGTAFEIAMWCVFKQQG